MSAPRQNNKKNKKSKKENFDHLSVGGWHWGLIKRFPPKNKPNYDPAQDEGLTQMTLSCPPAPKTWSASVPEMLQRFQKCEAEFKQSSAYKMLRKTLVSQVLKQNINITKCICFGLSSPTFCETDNEILYQLAAFVAVRRILSRPGTQPPRAFAQDPLFNTPDRQFLARLNISVVNHPVGFHHIDPTTFVYCPNAEYFVVRGAIARSPAIYMDLADFQTVPDDDTGKTLAYLTFYHPNDYPVGRRPSSSKTGEMWRASDIKAGEIVERFMKDKVLVKLPRFEENSPGTESDGTEVGLDMYLYLPGHNTRT